MHPVLFKIGGLVFFTHGLLAVFGIIVSSVLLFYYAKIKKIDHSNILDYIVLSVFFGIIGAKLTYFVMYRDQFSNISDLLYFWNGGLVSYGGFIAGGLTLYLILFFQKKPILRWFDILAVAFPIGLFFGRLGDFFAGDLRGDISYSKIAINGHIPVPLFEAGYLLILAFFLNFLIIRRKYRDGQILFLLIILYPFGRFFIDFFRDENNFFIGMSFGQFFSLIAFIISIIGYFIFLRINKKEYVCS